MQIPKGFNLSVSIDEKLKPLVKENLHLRNEVAFLNKNVSNTERDVRKNNLILHGLQEKETNNIELVESLITCLNNIYKDTGLGNWDKYEISRIQRVGIKDSNKTRSILFTLTLEWRKLELLRNKKRFPKNIYITEDYPKDILNIRKELKVKQQEEIKKGKIAFIRYDKLIVKDKNPVAKENEKRKRTPTDSPNQQDNTKRANKLAGCARRAIVQAITGRPAPFLRFSCAPRPPGRQSKDYYDT
ncbi:unnamed protein product [Chilo suppressalis]|uniref:Endonuclease-reverse transcriptase n=1 Tax=Chilo suppressalis TaxID=168631 RepID=A0ABN8B7I3_CHISP|nr:unnamed protein product [Chilo suppressalis]